MSAIPGVPLSGGVRVLIAAKPVDFRNYAECMIMLSLRQSAEYPRCSAIARLEQRVKVLSIILGPSRCRGGTERRQRCRRQIATCDKIRGAWTQASWGHLLGSSPI